MAFKGMFFATRNNCVFNYLHDILLNPLVMNVPKLVYMHGIFINMSLRVCIYLD